jgi:imidazolonepropionase-like amidohydrolase
MEDSNILTKFAVYYKVEAYTASERAGAILYAHNITPTYVSDNPVLNSQHVVFEAAKAYGHGLPYHAALAGVTSAPAELLGLGNRIGKIKAGFDADIVLWDSDPLSVGATPVQVWIDGAAQFKDPVELEKPAAEPIQPNVGLADELGVKELSGQVIFKGVSHVYLDGNSETFEVPQDSIAIVLDGKISCIGPCIKELDIAASSNAHIVELQDGHITPPFTAFGSAIGLVEIDAEPETQDGPPPVEGITRAVDGLAFGGKQLARAFEHGVTHAISAPGWGSVSGHGISAGFRTGAKNSIDGNAVWNEELGFHYSLEKDDKTPSMSSAIALLRAKLLDAVHTNSTTDGPPSKEQYEEAAYLKRVVSGAMPLIIAADSADVIASLIRLRYTVDMALADAASTASTATPRPRWVIIGGAESHLVAQDLADADISIVLAPLLPHAQTWDQRRCLTGAPLTNGTTINYLLDAGVRTAISVEEVWETRDLGLLVGIAYANSEGRLGFQDALDLVGKNIYTMLGIEEVDEKEQGAGWNEWVVWEGSPLQIGGRIRGIGSGTDRAAVWQ